MIDKPGLTKTILRLLFFCFAFSIANEGFAQNGQQLFMQNCAQCHSPLKDVTGPALQGVDKRGDWTERKNLYDWIHNPSGYAQKSAYAKGVADKYLGGGIQMQAFPSLTEKDIDAIVDYVNSVKAPVVSVDPEKSKTGDDNSLLFGILTLILAVVAFILLQVNSNLK